VEWSGNIETGHGAVGAGLHATSAVRVLHGAVGAGSHATSAARVLQSQPPAEVDVSRRIIGGFGCSQCSAALYIIDGSST